MSDKNDKTKNRVTAEEYDVIKKMVADGMTDERIATELCRHIETIRSVRRKMGLHKKQAGKMAASSAESQVKNTGISKKLFSEDERFEAWIVNLRKSQRYNRLQRTLTVDELVFFEEQWAKLHIQFEDLSYSEEDDLEQLIKYEIRIQDNDRQRKEAKLRIAKLEEAISGLDRQLDLENEEDRYMYDMVNSGNRFLADLNKDYRDLTTKKQEISESLNATRQQREAKSRVGGDTFLSLIKSLNDADRRAEIGRKDELMRLATEKQMLKMKEKHLFMDGEEKPLLLDGSDYVGISNEQNTSNGEQQSISPLPDQTPPQ